MVLFPVFKNLLSDTNLVLPTPTCFQSWPVTFLEVGLIVCLLHPHGPCIPRDSTDSASQVPSLLALQALQHVCEFWESGFMSSCCHATCFYLLNHFSPPPVHPFYESLESEWLKFVGFLVVAVVWFDLVSYTNDRHRFFQPLVLAFLVPGWLNSTLRDAESSIKGRELVAAVSLVFVSFKHPEWQLH